MGSEGRDDSVVDGVDALTLRQQEWLWTLTGSRGG